MNVVDCRGHPKWSVKFPQIAIWDDPIATNSRGNMIDVLNGPRELSGNPNILTLNSTPLPSGLDVPVTYPRIVVFLESGKIAW